MSTIKTKPLKYRVAMFGRFGPYSMTVFGRAVDFKLPIRVCARRTKFNEWQLEDFDSGFALNSLIPACKTLDEAITNGAEILPGIVQSGKYRKSQAKALKMLAREGGAE